MKKVDKKKVDKKKFVVVRTYSAGAFAGYFEKRDGKEIQLSAARRLWYWSGAASLSQIAVDGVKNPTDCKFPAPVNITLTEAIEIIETTPAAQKSIEAVTIWQA